MGSSKRRVISENPLAPFDCNAGSSYKLNNNDMLILSLSELIKDMFFFNLLVIKLFILIK